MDISLKEVNEMKKSDLIKLEFEEDKDLPELFKRSLDKEPMGWARVQFIKDKDIRMGKFYWDEIRFVWNYYDYKGKPYLEIETLNGFKIIIDQNKFTIRPHKQMEDNCYIRNIPIFFDKINFYGEFEWTINISALRRE